MKKVLAIALTLTMLFAMTATAETLESLTESSQDVTATYVKNNGGTIYSVDITWGSLEYTYTETGDGKWNPLEHEYEDKKVAGWSFTPGADTITVTNHSNAGVTATMSFSSKINNVTGSFDNNILELATAVNTTVAEAPKGTASLTLEGTLPEDHTDKGVVGSVTITIEASDEDSESNDANTTPTITSMSTNSNLSTIGSNDLEITIEGSNLDIITTSNFNQYLIIKVYMEDEEPMILDVVGKNGVTYTYDSETATLKFSGMYFSSNKPSDVTKLEYTNVITQITGQIATEN